MNIDRALYLNKLIREKHNGMIKIITGIRRCGKSYLLFRLFYAQLIASGVDKEHIIQIDLEDRRNKDLRQADKLLSHIDEQITGEGQYYVLLDEVQQVEDFADVLNSYLKMPNVDIYVTGSNSRFLSKDVATEFRGRGIEIKISPLTFKEFMSAYDGNPADGLKEYMTFGGLPKLVSMQDDEQKVRYLEDLFQATYLSDIKERYKIKNDKELADLLDVLASSIGGLTNPTKLYNTFKTAYNTKLSRNTIDNYLDILQDVFLIEKSIRYDIKGRKYIGTPTKYYFSDLGLRNARLHFRQFEPTHLMENLIYNELRYRGFSVDVGTVTKFEKDNGKSIRKQLEVDFVCNKGHQRCYIQSALSLPTIEKQEQELQSLRSIDDSFKKFVITQDNIKKYQNAEGITFINLFDFLLDEDNLALK